VLGWDQQGDRQAPGEITFEVKNANRDCDEELFEISIAFKNEST
jgi:hypothetical protein